MKRTVQFLAAAADRETLAPILAALEEKGIRGVEVSGPVGRKDVVLAALSEHFYADADLTGRLLSLVGSEAENILPVQLDGAPVPDTLKNALYSRNIIPAAGREAGLLAERISAALPRRKSRLPAILGAAALVLVAGAGLLVWKSRNPAAVETIAPGGEDASILLPAGLTEADLAEIVDVVIVGDRMELYRADEIRKIDVVTNGNAATIDDWPVWETLAYRSREEDAAHFYDKEDGHEYSLTRYEDLRWLSLLPNLRFLSIALAEADADALPDLSGAKALGDVYLMDCRIDDLRWLSGAPVRAMELTNSTGSLRDFSPLTECAELEYLYIDLDHTAQADFSGFAPPGLECLFINHGEELRTVDLSAMAGCGRMSDLNLTELPVTDVSFLEGMPEMRELRLTRLRQLRDISAVGGLKKLRNLTIEYCPRLTDYSPIAGCTALEAIHVQGDDNPDAVRDASFLSGLPKLRDIGLYACNLRDMDFLEGVADNAPDLRLGFAGDIRDYSGLAYVKNYEYLHVNPRYNNNNRGGDFAAVLPYIREAEIKYLMLYSCQGVDLSQLPDGIRNLSIRYGDLPDLRGLKPYVLDRLELWGCQYLTSLNGLEGLPGLASGRRAMELSITDCPRLTDYSALSGARLSGLKLAGVYALPDLRVLTTDYLRLESIEGMTDLSVLGQLSDSRPYDSIELVGLDQVRDLSPVRRLKVGHLTVPPHLAEQAEELAEDGRVDAWEVAYPDGSWQPLDGAVELLSLSELETLPRALLRRVERLSVAGGELMPTDGDIRQEWDPESDAPVFFFHRWDTDELTPIEIGPGVVTDLGMFRELTGLRELRLFGQPLEDLQGIQALSSLENLSLTQCPALTDVSAVFTLQELRSLDLSGCPVADIQGVQNLRALTELNLNDTQVTDLSPLARLDYGAAAEAGGFRLRLNGTSAEDLAPLAAIPVLDNLDINDVDAGRFLPFLENTEVHRLAACGVFTNRNREDPDALFADFVRSHPGLTELWIPWNQGLRDLTPLLELEELEYVRVSFDMEEAIASLDGRSIGFELEIEG